MGGDVIGVCCLIGGVVWLWTKMMSEVDVVECVRRRRRRE